MIMGSTRQNPVICLRSRSYLSFIANLNFSLSLLPYCYKIQMTRNWRFPCIWFHIIHTCSPYWRTVLQATITSRKQAAAVAYISLTIGICEASSLSVTRLSLTSCSSDVNGVVEVLVEASASARESKKMCVTIQRHSHIAYTITNTAQSVSCETH